MPEITINGCVRVTPTKIPVHVDAKRSLESILLELKNFHKEFINIDIENNPEMDEDEYCTIPRVITALYPWIRELKIKYSDVLSKSENALESLTEGSEEQRKYYAPLLAFLSRAKTAHSILPFEKYLHSDYEDLRGLKDFISLRISESIYTCQSYIMLLSQSMNEPIKRIDLNGIVNRAFNISKLRARNDVFAHTNKILSPNTNKSLRQSRVNAECYGEIYSLEPLLFFYLINTFGNHFKAAHKYYYGAKHSKCREEEAKKLPVPNVQVSIEPYGPYHVAVTSSDNGIGIPGDRLPLIFEGQKKLQGTPYERNVGGMGATVPVFPLICDFLSATLEVRSAGLYKGCEFKLILPKDLEKPVPIFP